MQIKQKIIHKDRSMFLYSFIFSIMNIKSFKQERYHSSYILLADQIVTPAQKSHNVLQLRTTVSVEMKHILLTLGRWIDR